MTPELRKVLADLGIRPAAINSLELEGYSAERIIAAPDRELIRLPRVGPDTLSRIRDGENAIAATAAAPADAKPIPSLHAVNRAVDLLGEASDLLDDFEEELFQVATWSAAAAPAVLARIETAAQRIREDLHMPPAEPGVNSQ